MKRFLLWCRKPYLRIHFAEPNTNPLAEQALTTAQEAIRIAERWQALASELSDNLAKLRGELHAYVCSGMDEDAQIAELEQLQGRSEPL